MGQEAALLWETAGTSSLACSGFGDDVVVWSLGVVNQDGGREGPHTALFRQLLSWLLACVGVEVDAMMPPGGAVKGCWTCLTARGGGGGGAVVGRLGLQVEASGLEWTVLLTALSGSWWDEKGWAWMTTAGTHLPLLLWLRTGGTARVGRWTLGLYPVLPSTCRGDEVTASCWPQGPTREVIASSWPLAGTGALWGPAISVTLAAGLATCVLG